MIKDTFFSFPRFVNLCRKEMVESWKSHLLRVAMMYGALVLVFLLNGLVVYNQHIPNFGDTDPAWGGVLGTFVAMGIAFACFSASLMMERMKSKTSRLSVLMTPVTPFEYYISRWLVYTLAFLVVYLIVFMLADYTRVLFFSINAPQGRIVEAINLSSLNQQYDIFSHGKVWLFGISTFLFTQSCFVLGSTIWPKRAFLKTFVAGLIINTVFSVFLSTSRFIKAPLADTDVNVFSNLSAIVLLVLALFHWVLAYYRFKESEIIHRM